MVFSTVLCLVGVKSITQEYNPSRFQKSNWYIPNESAWPWHLGRESDYQRRMAPKGRHLIFIFNKDFFTSGQYALFFNN